MNEVMIDLRNYDLADRLKLDMISVDSLLRELEDALDTIDTLNEKIGELTEKYEPDAFDIWHDRVIENDR
jgi:two-component SAPR family response regulator